MLGGLAAGLGLAWLAHSLGMGEGMGQFMMFALLALVIMMAVRPEGLIPSAQRKAELRSEEEIAADQAAAKA